uniref:Uncharacterized protein n=1 Tax=Marseillevirus LCMAC103 TaxID=2506604 RepID=A0A481YVX9_9VIRU|nr:MAG: uncharacterized protein LCMAC103_00330 [Marseillevirus LCMAC103]
MTIAARKTLDTVVWIHGTPPYALYYKNGSKDVPVELQSFRPDPSRVLSDLAKKYAATLTFEKKPFGIQGVRRMAVHGCKQIFVRVR